MRFAAIQIVAIIFFMSFNVYADYLKITSNPTESEVYVRAMHSDKKVKVGVTPYDGDIDSLSQTYGKNGIFIIEVSKEEYEKNSIIISDVFKGDMDIHVTLEMKQDRDDNNKKSDTNSNDGQFKALGFDYTKLERNLNELFEAQRLMRAAQYNDAINLLKRTEVEQKNISIVPELIGSAYYLKKEPRAALVWFEKAYRMNPENKDAYIMKEYIKKALRAKNER